MIVLSIGILGWIWAISTELHMKLLVGINLNIRRFKILFLIPFIYVFGYSVWMVFNFYGEPNAQAENIGLELGILIFLHLFSMVCIFLGLRFAAKTMKSVELGRMAKFGDYAGEFLLIWFSPIGVWILQPRLNKLTED